MFWTTPLSDAGYWLYWLHKSCIQVQPMGAVIGLHTLQMNHSSEGGCHFFWLNTATKLGIFSKLRSLPYIWSVFLEYLFVTGVLCWASHSNTTALFAKLQKNTHSFVQTWERKLILNLVTISPFSAIHSVQPFVLIFSSRVTVFSVNFI